MKKQKQNNGWFFCQVYQSLFLSHFYIASHLLLRIVIFVSPHEERDIEHQTQ